jgi:hypothetical protein
MRTVKLLVLGMVTTCLAGASAQSTKSMRDFSWLAGDWCMSADGEVVEEHWMVPRGNLMLGLSRTISTGKATSFEFMRIEFTPIVSFVAQPNGAPPTRFALTAAGVDWARFENPLHDFPKRVEYRRVVAGLHAEIAGPGKGGKEQVIGFEYRGCEPTPPA